METISLEDMMTHLKYKDERSARNWCARNKVIIIEQGKAEYAIKADFIDAFYCKPLMCALLKKYSPQEAKKIYTAYKEGKIEREIILDESRKVEIIQQYRPSSPIIQKYLNKYSQDEKKKSA